MGSSCNKAKQDEQIPQDDFQTNIAKLARRTIDEFYDSSIELNGTPISDFLQTDNHFEPLCYIKVTFNKKEYACAGCLLGPKHVLTAARNLFDPRNGDWASQIQVFINLDPGVEAPISFPAKYGVIMQNWQVGNETLSKCDDDIGIIVLNQAISQVTEFPTLSQKVSDQVIVKGYHYALTTETKGTIKTFLNVEVIDLTLSYQINKKKIIYKENELIHPITGSPIFNKSNELCAIYHHAIYDQDPQQQLNPQQNVTILQKMWIDSVLECERGKSSPKIKFGEQLHYYIQPEGGEAAQNQSQLSGFRRVIIGEDEFDDDGVHTPSRYDKTKKEAKSILRQNSLVNQKKLSIITNTVIQKLTEQYGAYTLETIQGLEQVTQSAYQGYVKDGMKHGNGKLTEADGSVYEGEFSHDKKHGKGRQFFINGDAYFGDFYSNQITGHGTFIYQSGIKYEGQVFNGKPHGQGKQGWADGSMYDGQFFEGKRNGTGVFVFSDGNTYHGDFRNDFIEGSGSYKWTDGREYQGNFVQNQMHGYGLFKEANNTKYTGFYQNDQRNGEGLLEFEDGRSYRGCWKDGVLHGNVIYTDRYGKEKEGEFNMGQRVRWLEEMTFMLTDPSQFQVIEEFTIANQTVLNTFFESGPFNNQLTTNQIFRLPNWDIYQGYWKGQQRDGFGKCIFYDGSLYEGFWKNDLAHGLGRRIYITGDVYRGAWKHGKAHGHGQLAYVSGDVYIGEFVSDHRTGYGIYRSSNGQVYTGNFWKGQKQGHGTLVMLNGSKYEGNFEGDRFQGQGSYKWKDGRSVKGVWTNGKLNGYGTCHYPDGRIYKGNFKDDQMEGFGEFIYTDGSSYHGSWVNGKQHGHGQVVMQDGKVIKGEWFNGIRKESLASIIS